jgi:hypothetical protein
MGSGGTAESRVIESCPVIYTKIPELVALLRSEGINVRADFYRGENGIIIDDERQEHVVSEDGRRGAGDARRVQQRLTELGVSLLLTQWVAEKVSGSPSKTRTYNRLVNSRASEFLFT